MNSEEAEQRRGILTNPAKGLHDGGRLQGDRIHLTLLSMSLQVPRAPLRTIRETLLAELLTSRP